MAREGREIKVSADALKIPVTARHEAAECIGN
jgi:hypothetical protein